MTLMMKLDISYEFGDVYVIFTMILLMMLSIRCDVYEYI